MFKFLKTASVKLFSLKLCKYCRTYKKDVKSRHLGTRYETECLNYQTSCIKCFNIAYEYYEELKRDLYS